MGQFIIYVLVLVFVFVFNRSPRQDDSIGWWLWILWYWLSSFRTWNCVYRDRCEETKCALFAQPAWCTCFDWIECNIAHHSTITHTQFTGLFEKLSTDRRRRQQNQIVVIIKLYSLCRRLPSTSVNNKLFGKSPTTTTTTFPTRASNHRQSNQPNIALIPRYTIRS